MTRLLRETSIRSQAEASAKMAPPGPASDILAIRAQSVRQEAVTTLAEMEVALIQVIFLTKAEYNSLPDHFVPAGKHRTQIGDRLA